MYYRGYRGGFRVPHERDNARLPGGAGVVARFKSAYSRSGAIVWAKLLRARFRRLLTVPRLQPVISAISA